MTGSRRSGAVAALACVLAVAVPVAAQSSAPGVDRAESRLTGRSVPDIPIVMADGQRAQLSDRWRDKPLLLTEIGRRQRAGVLPTVDGRYVHGVSDDTCIDMLRQNYGS